MKQIGDGMVGSIPFACRDWANTKAAYRFFANERVEEVDILSGHFAATRARNDDCTDPILLIQDTTEFSYQRANTSAIGLTKSVNSGRDKDGRWRHHTVCGTLMPSSLAVTVECLPPSGILSLPPCSPISGSCGTPRFPPHGVPVNLDCFGATADG
ncbi:hypothetical protein IVB25_23060 [Bradyrhizobium sp. 193]|uniref:transposase DNA-binding-containing protein n=1 Tax=Bradyrhizobium sp. 193 TaxID=2782661 RepID=UPI001FFAF314|nr:transposase DNA-binding-containing protein [Bradyrhizobium sp. 193]MCK1485492.1 hypothetical protein [Bradyrhizobium sp. 193]